MQFSDLTREASQYRHLTDQCAENMCLWRLNHKWDICITPHYRKIGGTGAADQENWSIHCLLDEMGPLYL